MEHKINTNSLDQIMTESYDNISEDKHKQQIIFCPNIKTEDFDCEENLIVTEDEKQYIKSELVTFKYLDEAESSGYCYNNLLLQEDYKVTSFKLEKDDVKYEPENIEDSDDIFEEKEINANEKYNLKSQNNIKHQDYRCDKCDFKTTHFASWKRHILHHKKTKILPKYQCPQCNYQCRYKCNLFTHMLDHDTEFLPTDKKVCKRKCPICDYQSNDPSNIRRHILNHNKSNTKTYTCFHCGHQTNRKDNLVTHISRRHKPKLECNFENGMQTHNVHRHKPKEGFKHKCNKCNFEAASISKMQIHKQSHANAKPVKIYRCNDCTYETIYKLCMDRHSVFHKSANDVDMYQCFLCDYRVVRKDDLKNHISRHSKKSKSMKTHFSNMQKGNELENEVDLPLGH